MGEPEPFDWDANGDFWHGILGLVDDALATIQEQVGTDPGVVLSRVLKNRWDSPDRTYEYLSADGSWRVIHALILGDVLRINASAFRDIEVGTARLRCWCHSTESMQSEWSVQPVKSVDAGIAKHIRAALQAAVTTVGRWQLVEGPRWLGTGLENEPVAPIPG